MRIHGFWDGGACGMIRILQPLDALRDFGGHQITTSCGFGASSAANVAGVLADAVLANVVVAQRLDRDQSSEIWRRLAPGRKLVYEIDDDLWNIDRTNINALRLRRPEVQYMVESCIASSDVVTVTTEPLAERVRPYNSNIRILPNCIESRMLDLKRPRRDHLVVGWAGGDSHIADLAMIHKPLQRFFRQNPEVEFHNVGTDFRGLIGVPGRLSSWHPDLFTYYAKIDFDIALAPLCNTVFNRSKSGIKALEAMALGIPVIASDIEPYRAVVEHGKTGFLVSQEHEWTKYLRLLASDESLREKMGAAGREAAREWTIEKHWWLWQEAYTGSPATATLGVAK